jgi:hypothetical protein
VSNDYPRVLPRDAFNEANLLKCIGELTLLIENDMLPGWAYVFDGRPFAISQDASDGSISVGNISFTKDRETVSVSTPLNSRRGWPLLVNGAGYDYEFVFDEAGNFSLPPIA